jgi:hypothetical protein
MVWDLQLPEESTRGLFRLTRLDIEKLKELVSLRNYLHKHHSLSPFLTYLILWLRLPPVQRIFFYEFPHQTSLFFNTLLPKLKRSLSHTLFHFYPLLGHLIWPHDSHKPIIKHLKGNSLLLTVAESDADFNNLSGNNLC